MPSLLAAPFYLLTLTTHKTLFPALERSISRRGAWSGSNDIRDGDDTGHLY